MTGPNTPAPPDQPTNPIQATPQPAALPHTPPQETTPPAKPSNTRAWAVGVIALILAIGCGAIGVALLNDDEADPAAGASATAAASPTRAGTAKNAPAATAPPRATYGMPTESDFTLNVKVLRKQCFGSAGCNITYRIEVTYSGPALDPLQTYEVTYEVNGGEDPIVNTLEVTGDSASVPQEERAGTRRSSDKLKAVVTSVSEL